MTRLMVLPNTYKKSDITVRGIPGNPVLIFRDTAGDNFYARNRLEAHGTTFLNKPIYIVMGKIGPVSGNTRSERRKRL